MEQTLFRFESEYGFSSSEQVFNELNQFVQKLTKSGYHILSIAPLHMAPISPREHVAFQELTTVEFSILTER
ncbi:hypothetical protein A3G63_02940 [Candidatus Kaiserbacteria bacterium RIFCSPLOWO2_12_FULL_52_8]|uniref:DUF4177 domain-containing protein n=1 Tax=Candidatus Kaiserbacteria bacterium RIFCSPHIGHO2_01_FULL_53_31 TaxID=1798481 RepID=A0A1F6CIU1_9BACT|nr:MAG: hypothetical protein A2678_01255 [Candidatus Kaiserbacteria bacterium RIFCSPHIGHO2_01_FULL_53_31]OGG94551.1 MAG: hypothetical protein A3G63_02940 [Candidatus Kaiserbacteria bacterium RIFCSPLOWO2_12_FULL_52_8]